mgnify:CR=1 FL=1
MRRVDQKNVIVLRREILEDGPCLIQCILIFERIRFISPGADSLQTTARCNVKNQSNIWLGRELMVDLEDLCDICPPRSLIGCGRVVVAIENNDSTRIQHWLNRPRNVVTSIFHKVIELILQGQSTRRRRFAQLLAPVDSRRLLAEGAQNSPLAEKLSEESALRGFSCAINTIDDDEQSAWKWSLHAPILTKPPRKRKPE